MEFRRLGDACLPAWRAELGRAEAELERLRADDERREEPDPPRPRPKLPWCTKCRKAPAGPRYRWCEACRAKRRQYMAIRRAHPVYREREQALQNRRRQVRGRSDARTNAEARIERLRTAAIAEVEARAALDREAAALFAEAEAA